MTRRVRSPILTLRRQPSHVCPAFFFPTPASRKARLPAHASLPLTMAVSISLLLSYVVDWLVIIIAAIVGAVFNFIPPNHRAFNLVDPEISFPITDPETVSVRTLGLVALFAPAVIIPLVCLLLVPGPTVARAVPRAVVWRRKLWEWHTGWLGLALSCAMTFFFTQGLKLLFGRQRPDLLARCFPDGPPDDARIKQFQVGGLGEIELQSMGAILVQWGICRQPDVGILHDGFMSFPSGHASCQSPFPAPSLLRSTC